MAKASGTSVATVLAVDSAAPNLNRPRSPVRGLLMAVAAGIVIWAVPHPEAVEPRGWHLLAIFVATIVGIITRPLPMGAIAMIAIAVTLLTRTLDLAEVLAGFSNSSVWLVVSAFLLAGTFIRTGLGRRIAYRFLSAFGHRTLGLSYSLAATDLVLAPVIPSHAARSGGVVFPVLQSLAHSLGAGRSAEARTTAQYLTLATYQSTVVISGMFLTSMAANPLAAQFAGQQGITITWTMWALAAAVPGLASLVIVPLIIYTWHPPAIRYTPDAKLHALKELAQLGPMRRQERILLAVFAALLIAWSLGPSLGIDSTAAIFIALGVLLLTGVLAWDDVAREHEAWSTFIWFAALIMMATELAELGVTKWFGESVSATVGGVGWVTGFLVLSLAYFYSHYLFASNTAHVSAMFAPFLAIALALGTPPLLAVFVLAFFSNLFAGLTHYASSAAPIFFGPGYVPLGMWWKVGGLLSIVNITIWLVVGGLWWKMLGLW